jgi:peptidoglycan-N-acetylglucosamine deacetylase
MQRNIRGALLGGILGLLLVSSADAATRQIAITLDDGPREDTPYFDGPTRTAKLLATLKAAKVEQAAFFCNSIRMDASGAARIKAYAQAGHIIANHSHSHADLHQVGVEAFLADVAKADIVLRKFDNFKPWLRFPYLREGKTIQTRDTVRSELKKRGYFSAYVTVDTFDWHMDRMFQDALNSGKTIAFDRLRDAYVDLVVDGIEFYDDMAVKQLGRSPQHVLLLHENDLAALYLGDLVARLRSTGWKIVSPEAAYRDPIAAVEPDTLLLGQGRILAMTLAKGGYQGAKGRWEDEEELRVEFERRRVWE